MSNRPVIVSAVRTSGGKFGGKFKNHTAVDLGEAVVKEAVRRAGISGEEVDELIFGCGWQAGAGPNVARLVTVKSGLPVDVPAFTVNIRCASGLKAVALAAQSVIAGESEVVVAGGTESTTNVPYILPEARWGQRMGDKLVVDVMHKDGFMCPLAGMLMGATAEILAERYNISREEQDQFALESHQKAVRALEEGKFKEEILPIEIKSGKTVETYDGEEIPRKDTNLEALNKLPPVFKKDGTVTAGNSCALADAAAAVVVMSEQKAKALGLKPMAAIRSYAYTGVDPKVMGIGPVKAIPIALKKAGLELKDIDLIELNEAFAAQVLACERELKWDRSKLNVHGGAIALGHPVGATGAKILTTLLYALKTYDKTLGLISLCIGGGQGIAMVVERLN
ncbi:MAG: acetyl-CoA C-acetyltransferase [Clostridia bacterium]|nr:acetyl-CoA C-acetyltransferase [Clostridia bacterium]